MDDPGGCQLTKDKRIKGDRWWRPGWLPFTDANGDMLVIDTDPSPRGTSGQVFKFYNSGGRSLQVVAASFAEWLSSLADELEARRFRLDEYGGIWLENLHLVYP